MIYKLVKIVISLCIVLFMYNIYFRSGRMLTVVGLSLVVACVAHCIELECFFWFVLMPPLEKCFSRTHRTTATYGHMMGLTSGRLKDLALFSLGPCMAVLIPLSGWAGGYRVVGINAIGDLVRIAALFVIPVVFVPLALYSVLSRLSRGETSFRDFATVALLALTVPCVASFEPAFYAGRKRLEREIGLWPLARGCIEIVNTYGRTKTNILLNKQEVLSPSIRRLRGTSINVQYNYVSIELHGGFDHFGYQLVKDEPNSRWVLSWYTEEVGGDQLLLNIPFVKAINGAL